MHNFLCALVANAVSAINAQKKLCIYHKRHKRTKSGLKCTKSILNCTKSSKTPPFLMRGCLV